MPRSYMNKRGRDVNKTSCMSALEPERWKFVVGYAGMYFVSDLGRIRRHKRILKPINVQGYQRFVLYKNGRRRQRYANELVAEAFIGQNPECGSYEVIHRNSDRSDNRLCNLGYRLKGENPSRDKDYA